MIGVQALCVLVGVLARNKAARRKLPESEYYARQTRPRLGLELRPFRDGTDTDMMLPHLSEDIVMEELSGSCNSTSECDSPGSSNGGGGTGSSSEQVQSHAWPSQQLPMLLQTLSNPVNREVHHLSDAGSESQSPHGNGHAYTPHLPHPHVHPGDAKLHTHAHTHARTHAHAEPQFWAQSQADEHMPHDLVYASPIPSPLSAKSGHENLQGSGRHVPPGRSTWVPSNLFGPHSDGGDGEPLVSGNLQGSSLQGSGDLRYTEGTEHKEEHLRCTKGTEHKEEHLSYTHRTGQYEPCVHAQPAEQAQRGPRMQGSPYRVRPRSEPPSYSHPHPHHHPDPRQLHQPQQYPSPPRHEQYAHARQPHPLHPSPERPHTRHLRYPYPSDEPEHTHHPYHASRQSPHQSPRPRPRTPRRPPSPPDRRENIFSSTSFSSVQLSSPTGRYHRPVHPPVNDPHPATQASLHLT